MSILAASNSKKPRPSPPFFSLPDDIVLNCLARVPRCYDLTISCVSKTLRSLVRSAELYRLRTQLLPKKSIYLSFRFFHGDCIHWITFRPGEKKTTDYMPCESSFSASLEEKVYIVDRVHVKAYNLTEGISSETRERLSAATVKRLCVVEDVLYASKWCELMWFNTKLRVWRRVVDRDGKIAMYSCIAEKMVEYEGKLAFLWPQSNSVRNKKNIMCKLIAFDRLGDEVRGTIEWSGVVATFAYNICLKDSLVVSH